MKKLNLIVLSLAALVSVRPSGCCTLNAAKAEETTPDRDAEIETLKAQIAELQALAAGPAAPEEPTSALALMAKGAGVDLSDVRWRVQAGLDPDQAVQAALSQKEFNAAAAKAAKAKK